MVDKQGNQWKILMFVMGCDFLDFKTKSSNAVWLNHCNTAVYILEGLLRFDHNWDFCACATCCSVKHRRKCLNTSHASWNAVCMGRKGIHLCNIIFHFSRHTTVRNLHTRTHSQTFNLDTQVSTWLQFISHLVTLWPDHPPNKQDGVCLLVLH